MKFAPLSLFSAFATTASGDPDLPDGIHLRLGLSPDLGPPLAPFAIWQTTVNPKTILAGSGSIALSADALDTQRIVAIAAADAGNLPKALVIADPSGGEIARRSSGPWQVAAPAIQSARIEGGSPTTQIGLMSVAATDFGRFLNVRPNFLLPLPIAGACVWYANGSDQKQGLDRVKRGAPKRLTPVDQPAGPFAALTPDAELIRVQAATEIASRLELLLRQDPKTPPAVRTMTLSTQDKNQPAIQIGVWDSLLIQTGDIGYARFAGLATTLEGTLSPLPPGGSVGRTILPGFWIAGLFAMAPEGFTQTIPSPLGGDPLVLIKHFLLPDADEQQLIAGFRAVAPGIDTVIKTATAAGLQIRPMLTFCAAPLPADPPRAGKIAADPPKWIAATPAGASTFRQGFTFTDQPLASTLAMSASFGGGAFQPRTAVVANSGGRRRPLLVARLDSGIAAASDTQIPTAPAPITYHFHAGDLFGRYGGASTIVASPPATPPPPMPVVQAVIKRASPLPTGTGAVSPGTLTVIVPVPGIDALPAGARPIQTVKWSFPDGTAGAVPATASPVSFALPLPALTPMATGNWPLTVQFIDGGGTGSPIATQTVTITDGRAPPAVSAGTGIIWTSRPGPAPEVELNLRWKASAGQSYRCYLASAASLKLDGATRAGVATAAGTAKLAERGVYQLLSDPPIVAGADGYAHLSATLPRALRSVGFVKVVALSPQGVEADFAASGVVPVAVPSDLPPPPPRVFATPNADGTAATVTVSATGLDLVALQAAEPGLFSTPPKPDAKPPTVRLRRASGPVNDPLYARAVGAPVPLVRQPDGSFAADIADAGLVPFVRCTWWADVRMPDERRLPAGVAAIAGDVLPEPGASVDMSGMPSSLSAPFTTVPAPALPPAPLPVSALQAKLVPSGITRTATITVSSVPVAPPGAVGVWRLRVWWRWGDFPMQLVQDAPTTTTSFTWTSSAMLLGGTISFWVALVDPLGRESATTRIDAV